MIFYCAVNKSKQTIYSLFFVKDHESLVLIFLFKKKTSQSFFITVCDSSGSYSALLLLEIFLSSHQLIVLAGFILLFAPREIYIWWTKVKVIGKKHFRGKVFKERWESVLIIILYFLIFNWFNYLIFHYIFCDFHFGGHLFSCLGKKEVVWVFDNCFIDILFLIFLSISFLLHL